MGPNARHNTRPPLFEVLIWSFCRYSRQDPSSKFSLWIVLKMKFTQICRWINCCAELVYNRAQSCLSSFLPNATNTLVFVCLKYRLFWFTLHKNSNKWMASIFHYLAFCSIMNEIHQLISKAVKISFYVLPCCHLCSDCMMIDMMIDRTWLLKNS